LCEREINKTERKRFCVFESEGKMKGKKLFNSISPIKARNTLKTPNRQKNKRKKL
jgi:hypothetical protein